MFASERVCISGANVSFFFSCVKRLGNSNSSWITSSTKTRPHTKCRRLNENANLLSVWSWLSISSDLHDYANHRDFWFLAEGGRETLVEPNWLSRLHSFDVICFFMFFFPPFKMEIHLKMFFFFFFLLAEAVATRWHNTSTSGCDLCKCERGRIKITDLRRERTVQSKSKSTLMASCVREGFDYQQAPNLSSSPPDGFLFFLPG